jgi:hypothetical protein
VGGIYVKFVEGSRINSFGVSGFRQGVNYSALDVLKADWIEGYDVKFDIVLRDEFLDVWDMLGFCFECCCVVLKYSVREREVDELCEDVLYLMMKNYLDDDETKNVNFELVRKFVGLINSDVGNAVNNLYYAAFWFGVFFEDVRRSCLNVCDYAARYMAGFDDFEFESSMFVLSRKSESYCDVLKFFANQLVADLECGYRVSLGAFVGDVVNF